MTDLSVNTLADRTPTIGDNLPPLEELLREEIAPHIERDNELVGAARTSPRIASLDDAERVTTLVALIRDQERTLTRAHEERKAPFLRDGRLVDRMFKPEVERLLSVRTVLERMLTQWQVARQNEARRERERLAAEQRQREEEAQRAREAAEAAKANGTGTIAAELDALRAQEAADVLTRQAETIRPERIQTAAGAVAMRREIAFAITDERKVIAWLLKTHRHELLQAAHTILRATLRGMGVDGAQHADIPGVEVTIESKASVR